MNDEFVAPEDEQERLDELSRRFLAALADKDAGRIDPAEDELHAILKVEPRLPEPRMELARILLDSDRVEEAEDHARLALEHLQAGGRWNEDVPEDTLRALAHALLAEILRRRLEEDAVIFGDPAEFKQMLAESQGHFAEARRLDPADEYANYYAFFLGPEGHGGKRAKDEDAD